MFVIFHMCVTKVHMTLLWAFSSYWDWVLIASHSTLPHAKLPLNSTLAFNWMSSHLFSNPSCPLNLENLICPRAFVNMSAGFSAPSTKYNLASLSSKHCRTKWYHISMCLDLLPWTGFDPKKMDPWLSPLIGTGPTFIPSLDKRVLIHLACLQQSHKTIYSALVDDKAMVFCARDCQEIEAPANWKK